MHVLILPIYLDQDIKMFHPKLKVKKLSDNAYLPTRASPKSAGLDLYSAYEYILPANGKVLVKTDLMIILPKGTYGRIASRSGLALTNCITSEAGVIDADYRGNVQILLFNFSQDNYVIHPGDRIAQLICEKYKSPVVKETSSYDITERNDKGFGSSGK